MPRALLPVALLLLVVLASGCTGSPAEPGLVAFTDIPEGQTRIDAGDFPITFRVLEEVETGKPVVDAPVLVYKLKDPYSPPQRVQDLVEAKQKAWGARTDADGRVEAHLGAGLTYAVAVEAPGYTVEGRNRLVLEPELRDTVVPILLYKENLTLVAQRVFPFTPTIHKYTELYPYDFEWDAKPVVFHEDPFAQKMYRFRASEVRGEIRWHNLPPHYADLGIAVGHNRDFNAATDYNEVTNIGVQLPAEESMERFLQPVPHSWLFAGLKYENRRPPEPLVAGAMTRMPVLMADGVPYTMKLEFKFSTEPTFECPYCYYSYVPGLDTWAVLGVLGVGAAAFATRRRR